MDISQENGPSQKEDGTSQKEDGISKSDSEENMLELNLLSMEPETQNAIDLKLSKPVKQTVGDELKIEFLLKFLKIQWDKKELPKWNSLIVIDLFKNYNERISLKTFDITQFRKSIQEVKRPGTDVPIFDKGDVEILSRVNELVDLKKYSRIETKNLLKNDFIKGYQIQQMTGCWNVFEIKQNNNSKDRALLGISVGAVTRRKYHDLLCFTIFDANSRIVYRNQKIRFPEYFEKYLNEYSLMKCCDRDSQTGLFTLIQIEMRKFDNIKIAIFCLSPLRIKTYTERNHPCYRPDPLDMN